MNSRARHLPPPQAFSLDLNALRLGEFDFGGVLYHANYFHLYEAGREALLADRGVPYPELVAHGAHLTVVESQQRFLHPVRYGEPLRLYVWVAELRRSTVRFDYEIVSNSVTNNKSLIQGQDPAAKRDPLHTAWTRHAFVEARDGDFRVSRMPEKLLRVLQLFLVRLDAD